MGTPKTVSATEREYARIGAALDLAAKQAEIDAILQAFPELRLRTPRQTAPAAQPPENLTPTPTSARPRRPWTAARRQRHSERMRDFYRRAARARAGVSPGGRQAAPPA